MAKEKRKALKITLITVGSILALVGVLAFVFLVVLAPKEIPTYSFSGYVYADGTPLAGAKVSCGVKQTETNDDGYYEFNKLTKVVEVTVSKDNYLFGNELVFVNSDKENINFDGFEIFSLNGVVKNGDELVPFAEVEVVSEMGTFKTRANAFGAFSLPRLAGEVKLNAYHENVKLFSQVFDKTKEELVVTGTTSLTGKINCDSTLDNDFVLKLNNVEISLNSDLSFSVSDVEPNSVLTLESENYYIDNFEKVVSIENGVFDFNAEKFYDIRGTVISGSTPLPNTRIVVGREKCYSNSLGEFVLTGQHGAQTIDARLQGYNFDSVSVNYENTIVNLVGKFNLNGKVSTDDGVLRDIEVRSGNLVALTNFRGEFTLNGVQLGDIVSVNNSNYFVKNNDLVVANTSRVSFDLLRQYSLAINVKYNDLPLENVNAIIGSLSYTTNATGQIVVPGLYGSNTIALGLDGYKFDTSYYSDYMHTTLDITPYKYFNIAGRVVSADKIISNAKVYCNGQEFTSNELGEFEISDLYLSGQLKVEAYGYNNKIVDYSISNNNLTIDLDYDINGTINCGNKVVDGVRVAVGDNVVYSDYLGKFRISNVTGENTLVFVKDFYTFENVSVDNGLEKLIDCTYAIRGTATNKVSVISDLEIKLVRNSGDSPETISTRTNERGEYEFLGLTGEYLMIYDTAYTDNLLPNGYTVDQGGIYNFSDCGYKIKGRVMSGNVPVYGVEVRAGDLVATTNEQGYYKFDLIIEDTTLVLSKDGYEFVNNNFPVDMTFDGREDVNFQCTYSVEGIVASGDTPLENVKVTMGGINCFTNENGYYLITGISGNVTPTAQYGDYYFSMPSEISSTGVCNITAMFDTAVSIKTGDTPVSDVHITVNGNEFNTDASGSCVVHNVQIGDTLEFSKQGYSINSYTMDEFKDSVSVNAKYVITGQVYITNSLLSGVKVECGEETLITDSNGYFEFFGLEGSNTITFTKDNYNFEPIVVSGYANLKVMAMFSVSGNVTVAGSGLENVKVTAGDKVVYTDQLGHYTINNLTSANILELEKYGYEFPGEFVANAPAIINIEATYRIAGKVKSGNIEISGATVKLSNGITLTSDDNGNFEVKGLEEVVSLEVNANGYNNLRVDNIDSFTNDLIVNLTYSVTINLTNITNLTGVMVSVGANSNTYDDNQIIFENLSGEQRITISKDGYNFSPSTVVVNKTTTLNVTIKKEFQVTGKITTTNNVPVAGVTISAGGKETKTDANGNYALTQFTDPVQVKLVMKVIDTAYKGENYDYSVNIDQVSADAIKNYTISDSEYAYFLFKNGYQKLNDAKTYQIFGGGTVYDTASKENQYVSIVYKKDSKNNRIIQNLNWHDGKIMGIVDPRIVQLTYVDMNSKVIKYQTITGSNVSNGTANWTTNWTQTDYASYLDSYGVNAEGYYPYVINKDTISTTSEIALTDGLYTFTFGLAMTEAMYGYYTTQMSKMCSSQTFKSFTYCNITYTVGQDGFIRTMSIDEQYQVTASIVNATVTDKFTYSFLTTSSNEMINDIKIGTVDEINASLAKETPTISINSSNLLDFDLFLEKRRKLV